MLQDTKKYKGVTLVELLVAVAILGIVSVISVQGLWDIVTSRNKQYQLENSSDLFRSFLSSVSRDLVESSEVKVISTSDLRVKGAKSCRVIRHNSTDNSIEEFVDTTDGCELDCVDDPVCLSSKGGFRKVSNESYDITKLEFSPVVDFPDSIGISIEGTFEDNLGSHNIDYTTSVSPRTAE
ncbi:MAG: prepilin-type N-terminal cleavage/methylation domain-containing protein [Candidatus Woesebacteria bacterium]|jgi:prepilin-type N-terminal cleavage/methylation domain-containing protein